MSKTIEIKRATIFKFFLSFILGFGILYCLEHYGQFGFLEEKEQDINQNKKISLTRYINPNSNVSTIIFTTFFKTEIKTNGNGFLVKDIYYTNGSFHKYSNKSYYYTKATFEDYKFGLYFSTAIFALLFFFSKFKIKIS